MVKKFAPQTGNPGSATGALHVKFTGFLANHLKNIFQ